MKTPQSHFIELKVFLSDESGLDMNSIRVDFEKPLKTSRRKPLKKSLNFNHSQNYAIY